MESSSKKIVEIVRHSIDVGGKGGITFYARHTEGDSFYTLSTAVCSGRDSYSRKTGYAIAKARHDICNTIMLPCKKEMTHGDLRQYVNAFY